MGWIGVGGLINTCMDSCLNALTVQSLKDWLWAFCTPRPYVHGVVLGLFTPWPDSGRTHATKGHESDLCREPQWRGVTRPCELLVPNVCPNTEVPRAGLHWKSPMSESGSPGGN